MTLEELQERFYRSLLGDGSALNELIAGNRRLPAQKSVAIYRNNMHSALARALQSIHPACHRILGAPYFNQLARAYAVQYPSRNGNLNHYGESFADFVAALRIEKKELADFPYLEDLIRLERQCHQAHYAADDLPFDLEQLAEVEKQKQGDLVFKTSHSLSLFSSAWPVRAIRELNLTAGQPAATIEPLVEKEYLVIHRAPPVTVSRVSRRHYKILHAVRMGDPLSAIVQRYGEMEMLSDWVQNKKWLQGFCLPIYNRKSAVENPRVSPGKEN